MNKVHSRELKEIERIAGRGKKYKKPEKNVEKECLLWMRAHGWDVDIYEAKAVYNPDGTYRSSRMKAGVSDCMGITPLGEAVYIEFKAKNRRSTFAAEKNIRQQEFLISKINMMGFAVVVDSVDRLKEYYLKWSEIKSVSLDEARDYLLDVLPKKRDKTKKERP